MNEFRIRSTGVVVNETEYRALMENVSLPAVISAEVLASIAADPALAGWAADPILASPAPSSTSFQAVQRDGVTQDGLGNWVWAWQVTDLEEEAVAAKLALDKAARWDAIKAERDRRKLEGGYKVAVSGVDKWFHSDTFSRTQQIGLVMFGAGIPAGLQWKTMDGSFVTMTQSLAAQVFAAAGAQDVATFAAAEAHKTAMEESEDPAGYNFSGGWPAIYGG